MFYAQVNIRHQETNEEVTIRRESKREALLWMKIVKGMRKYRSKEKIWKIEEIETNSPVVYKIVEKQPHLVERIKFPDLGEYAEDGEEEE